MAQSAERRLERMVDRTWVSGVRFQVSEKEDRGQKTEDRGQKTEDRGPKLGDKGKMLVSGRKGS